MFSIRQLPAQLTAHVGRWQRHSQQHAVRNARIATTALARRKVERAEVEAFFAALAEEPAQPEAPARSEGRAAHA